MYKDRWPRLSLSVESQFHPDSRYNLGIFDSKDRTYAQASPRTRTADYSGRGIVLAGVQSGRHHVTDADPAACPDLAGGDIHRADALRLDHADGLRRVWTSAD